MAKDIHWSNVVMGLHMDGPANFTAFTDIKGGEYTAFGNTKISIDQKAPLTGNLASAYFDGIGDYILGPASDGFAFGTGDFTIEAWVYAVAIPTKVNKFAFLLTHDNIGVARGWELFLNDVTGNLGFLAFSSNSEFDTVIDSEPFPIAQWVHVAVTRSGTNLRLFKNGNIRATDISAGSAIQNPNVGVLLGSNRDRDTVETSGGWNFNGYLDDVRVTKGVARYTANYTPPIAPFDSDPYEVSGTITDGSGNGLSRVVRAYRRDTGDLVGAAASSAFDGTYAIPTSYAGEVQVVMLDDVAGIFENDQILRTTPV